MTISTKRRHFKSKEMKSDMSTFPSFYSHHYEVCNDDDEDDDDEDEEIPLIENKRLNHRDTLRQARI